MAVARCVFPLGREISRTGQSIELEKRRVQLLRPSTLVALRYSFIFTRPGSEEDAEADGRSTQIYPRAFVQVKRSKAERSERP